MAPCFSADISVLRRLSYKCALRDGARDKSTEESSTPEAVCNLVTDKRTEKDAREAHRTCLVLSVMTLSLGRTHRYEATRHERHLSESRSVEPDKRSPRLGACYGQDPEACRLRRIVIHITPSNHRPLTVCSTQTLKTRRNLLMTLRLFLGRENKIENSKHEEPISTESAHFPDGDVQRLQTYGLLMETLAEKLRTPPLRRPGLAHSIKIGIVR